MDAFGIDIGQIVELGTRVAMHDAIRAAEMVADDIFEYVIGVAILIYEIDPS